jgi:hypothetical protein
LGISELNGWLGAIGKYLFPMTSDYKD